MRAKPLSFLYPIEGFACEFEKHRMAHIAPIRDFESFIIFNSISFSFVFLFRDLAELYMYRVVRRPSHRFPPISS